MSRREGRARSRRARGAGGPRPPRRRRCASAWPSWSASSRASAARARARGPARHASPALLHAGARGLSWASLARLQRAALLRLALGGDGRVRRRPALRRDPRAVPRVPVRGVVAGGGDGDRARPVRRAPALIVANHSGVLPYDGLMVQLAIRHEHPAQARLPDAGPRHVRAPARARPDAPRSRARSAPTPRTPSACSRQGELLGVFPEGVKGVGKYYKERYKLARFGRGGFVRIALRTGAPIIPCAVVGAEEIHPVIAKADWVGRPFGLPVLPAHAHVPLARPPRARAAARRSGRSTSATRSTCASYGPEAADDPILVNRISEEVRSTIQRMIDGRLARRRSVWFG